MPDGNERAASVREQGFGPFVTLRITVRPDGRTERWESRAHRKHLAGPAPAGTTWWAPADRDWWIGVLFAIGSFLFGLGAVPAYASFAGTRADAVTFFAGSVFFTSAAFLQYREAVDAAPAERNPRGREMFILLPGQIDWLATGIQLIGTVEFNVSTAVAIGAAVGSPQYEHHVWRPDVIGSACFLVASLLAWFEVCHGWAAWRPGSAAWWVTAANLAGSAAFGVCAVTSYVQPGTARLLSASATSLGTFLGSACFLAGAVLLLVERTEDIPAAPQPPGGSAA